MKKKFLIAFLAFVVVFGIILFSFFYLRQNTQRGIGKVYFNNHTFNIEIADTDILRTRGLSGRKYLLKDSGMLFIFPNASYHSFWMKGMQFPLDFIWIKDETIVDLTENVFPPKEKISDENLSVYSSRYPVNKVLEVNAGIIKAFKIKIGDKVQFQML